MNNKKKMMRMMSKGHLGSTVRVPADLLEPVPFRDKRYWCDACLKHKHGDCVKQLPYSRVVCKCPCQLHLLDPNL